MLLLVCVNIHSMMAECISSTAGGVVVRYMCGVFRVYIM